MYKIVIRDFDYIIFTSIDKKCKNFVRVSLEQIHVGAMSRFLMEWLNRNSPKLLWEL